MKKVFVTTAFDGWWPVGTCATIVADNAETAVKLLNEKLEQLGLAEKQSRALTTFDIEEIDIKRDGCSVWLEGNY